MNNTASVSAGLGIESVSNIPAARIVHSLTALTSVGILIMFGGEANFGRANDVWQLNTTTKSWTWLTGSIVSSYVAQVISGAPSSIDPGANSCHQADTLSGTDQLFVYGGYNNQVWMFDYNSNLWSLASSGPSNGLYWYSLNNQYPAVRGYNIFTAVAKTPLFMMMSGCPNGNGYCHGPILSDIWIYNSTSSNWYWLQGEGDSTNTGGFGTIGVNDGVSFPPQRAGGASIWSPSLGTLVLFGGFLAGLGYCNDIWYLALAGFANITVSIVTLPKSATISQISSSSMYSHSASMSSVTTEQQVSKPTATNIITVTTPFSLQSLVTQYYYVVIAVAVLIVAATFCCFWYCCNKLAKQRHRVKESHSTDTTEFDQTSMSTTVSNTTNSWQAGNATYLSGQTEFSVPAFLKYKAGAEFRWHKRVAKGGGSEVFLGDALIPKLQALGSIIIVKIVGANREAMTDKMNSAFDQEISVMHYLGQHRNIAGLLGWCDEPVAILMKYYPLGSLNEFIKNHYVNSKTVVCQFSVDIVHGLAFMHQKDVAHCDMKPANILVEQGQNGRLRCVLTDFGIAQLYSIDSQLVHAFKVANLRGASIVYAAPEAVSRFRSKEESTKELAFAGDVYSTGVILFALMNAHDGWK